MLVHNTYVVKLSDNIIYYAFCVLHFYLLQGGHSEKEEGQADNCSYSLVATDSHTEEE